MPYFLKFGLLLGLLCAQGFGDVTRRFSYPADRHELMKPQWQGDFVRTPRAFDTTGMPPRKIFCAVELGKVLTLDVRYLENHSRAQMKFYDWYLGDAEVSYVEQLRDQHETSALGQRDARQHYNHTTDAVGYQSNDAYPGRFRADLMRKRLVHLGVDEYVTKPEEWARLFAAGFSEPNIRRNGDAVEFLGEGYSLRARGIEEKLQTKIELLGGGKVRREAPKEESEAAFRQATADRMADLRKWRDKTPAEVKNNLDAFLNDLSDYYHTAVQWMPFSAINNSIFMGHVNVLLRHFDLKPMPHNGLDYLALMSHYDVFRGVFKAAVLSAQEK